MDHDAAARAAGLLLEARGTRCALAELPEACRPRTVDDGYRVQDLLVGLLGHEVGGWKIGSTSEKAQRIVGTTEPLAGRLLAPALHRSPAELRGGDFFMRALEAEFAFRLGRDLSGMGEAPGREAVLDAVASLHPAIEISDSRFRDWAAVGAPSLIADNGNEGQVVLGAAVDDWRSLDLRVCRARMRVNGAQTAEGSGADVLGDPVRALQWLVADRARRGEGLRAGQVVITGSCTGVSMAGPSDSAEADFGALGTVRVRFV